MTIDKVLEIADMRAVYTQALVDAAEKNEKIVLLEADLMSATGTKPFFEKYPERAFNCGVAEGNMVGIAGGLSASGFIPFANTFTAFAARKTYDQFYITCNYALQNVKLVGSDPGITALYNGGTHMSFGDYGLMTTMPQLTVVEPSDRVSMYKLTQQLADMHGNCYLRIHRKGAETFYDASEEFEIGKGKVLRDGTDVTIITAGMVMVKEALKAHEILKESGISAAILDFHTIKPLDEELVLSYAEKTDAIVTFENAQRANGLGSAVASYLAESRPTKVTRLGIDDLFGEVGDLAYLQERYKLRAEDLVESVKKTLNK
ncbi:MAG: transketolase family protein [Spirochaetes bacterium]|jgi:transketolase|nr:transketolase family protein [Spirochaetota bacterium]